MTRRPVQPVIAPNLRLTVDDMKAGITRLTTRLQEVKGFDVQGMKEHRPAELVGLAASVLHSLERTFGENTSNFKRFALAGDLAWRPGYVSLDGRPRPVAEAQVAVQRNIERSCALLAEAIKSLEEEV